MQVSVFKVPAEADDKQECFDAVWELDPTLACSPGTNPGTFKVFGTSLPIQKINQLLGLSASGEVVDKDEEE